MIWYDRPVYDNKWYNVIGHNIILYDIIHTKKWKNEISESVIITHTAFPIRKKFNIKIMKKMKENLPNKSY